VKEPRLDANHPAGSSFRHAGLLSPDCHIHDQLAESPIYYKAKYALECSISLSLSCALSRKAPDQLSARDCRVCGKFSTALSHPKSERRAPNVRISYQNPSDGISTSFKPLLELLVSLQEAPRPAIYIAEWTIRRFWAGSGE
jgi:hypothetical protein